MGPGTSMSSAGAQAMTDPWVLNEGEPTAEPKEQPW